MGMSFMTNEKASRAALAIERTTVGYFSAS